MSRLPGEHTVRSALQRLLHLLRSAGLAGTCAILFSAVDDKYFRSFDRRYRVRTSGFLRLSQTGFDPSRLRDATQYAPVSGWGFRKFLRELNLPHDLRFVDFGCGLGRACVLAAEYGFAKVTGVELAPELCAGARENAVNFRSRSRTAASIEIHQMDVLEYCERMEDDVVFMFRPFSLEFLRVILEKLVARSQTRRTALIIIYSERMLLPGSYANDLAAHPALRKVREAGRFGQAFYVFECGSQFAKRTDDSTP